MILRSGCSIAIRTRHCAPYAARECQHTPFIHSAGQPKDPKAMPSGLAAGSLEKRNATLSNLLRTKEKSMLPHCAFSHPDFTVGSGITPDLQYHQVTPLAGFTAGRDLVAGISRLTATLKAVLPVR
jgi:hypothetical protein